MEVLLMLILRVVIMTLSFQFLRPKACWEQYEESGSSGDGWFLWK